ncbi:PIG-L family deacetylase [Actinobacteria bacterium YIM 96077]|uniref:PIG-L family deacetylase n=1 Tax=Phytoactinopolyspora halophila TaxID=1981511 RepID=A0A329R1V6_9ACTN|nr:PIG-L deacetylase family protein [Phytoactinopolyspora halophila]AYY12160.1 PIG-L family deacetylase [Actinobacteria bacterium YIM 96077]RAW18605.1 PIG-L family deacetylase [Phytoactinopolyspora halophila]
MTDAHEPAVQPLQHLPEDWERGLALVPHPDDIEYGAAAAVARWTGQGKTISYALVSSGEAGIDSMPPEMAGPLREDEQRESARIVGVEHVEFLGYPDGMIEYGLPLRRDLSRVIRRHRPEIVITGNFRETYGGVFLNQADHIAVGRAVLDAIRDAGNRWVFRELLDEGLEPWNGVRALWAAASPEAGHAADITETFDTGVESLRAHRAYLAGLGEDAPDPGEFLESAARATGQGLGCSLATSFEVFTF